MFRNLKIKRIYDSNCDNLLSDFYIPVLSESIIYKRTTGYFSSGALVLASKGISSFIRNSGRMELIMGIDVGEEDYRAIKEGVENKYLLDYFRKEIGCFNVGTLDRLKLLSWMVSEDILTMKIAILPRSSGGIFHEKIGVFGDKNGNKISFSGSANETAGGWSNNQEEFKVFRSWIKEEKEWQEHDEAKFNKYWNGEVEKFSVIDIPTAIKEELLNIRPNDKELKKLLEKIVKEEEQEQEQGVYVEETQKPRPLYDYQKEAILKWKENNFLGILEMATGTGKTLTAIGCVKEVLHDKGRIFVIIAAPQKHLIEQWKEDISVELPNFSVKTCSGDNKNWRHELNDKLFKYKYGIEDRIIILTTYATLSSIDFQNIFANSNNPSMDYLFVADEMHNSGAEKSSKGLIKEFNFRLGLSATPERYFDDSGTRKIIQYFDRTVYEYDLKKAINSGKLTKYEYYPKITHLNNEEYEKYIKLTNQILFTSRLENGDRENLLEKLMMKRAQITKKTEEKYSEFNKIIQELINKGREGYLLIYCQDTQQLIEAQKIINKYGILNHRLTEKESTKERVEILNRFANGEYKCLVSMNCLDEGINVPATRTAIIMASTGNPRQYVQRRGRILRNSEGKKKAYIYDFIVLPPNNTNNEYYASIEREMIRKELKRVADFLDTADNKLEILNDLFTDVMIKYNINIFGESN